MDHLKNSNFIKIISLLVIFMTVNYCSFNKEGNNLLPFALLGDSSDSSSSESSSSESSPEVDYFLRRLVVLQDVIAVHSSIDLNTTVSAALTANDWTRLNKAGKVKVPKGTKLDFAIVHKTGVINDSTKIKIGSYTGTGKSDIIGFGNAILNTGYDSYGVIAVALIAKDASIDTQEKFTNFENWC